MKSIEKAGKKLAELDAGGEAVVVLRSESEADIRRVVDTYVHKYCRKINRPLEKFVIESASDFDNMKELTAFGTIKNFCKPYNQLYSIKDDYSKHNLFSFLVDHLSGSSMQTPCLLYIPHISYCIKKDYDNMSEEEKQYLYLIKQISIAKRLNQTRLLIVIGCNRDELYPELEFDTYILDIDYPQEDEIKDIILQTCQEHELHSDILSLNELVVLFQGFRIDMIRSTINRAYAKYENPLSNEAEKLKEEIKEAKLQILKKASDAIIWLDTDHYEIEGLGSLRNWIKEKELLLRYSNIALIHKVSLPQGIVVTGIPGTGKSLLAKWIAQTLQLPLFQLDMSNVLGHYVGQSEQQFNQALKLVEAMAPCVLFIDEIEKVFSGVNNQEDAYMKRILASFLSWLQQGQYREKPIFIFATANQLNLPSEFLRKGRIDEKFYTFMPTKEECKQILLLHILKHKEILLLNDNDIIKEVIEPFMQEAVRLHKFLTGADIASIVSEAFQSLFVSKIKNLSNEKERQSASITIDQRLKVNLDELKLSLFYKLNETKVYSETDMDHIVKYWFDIKDSHLRNASLEDLVLSFDDYLDNGMFKNLISTKILSKQEYSKCLAEKIDNCNEYNKCFKLILAKHILEVGDHDA